VVEDVDVLVIGAVVVLGVVGIREVGAIVVEIGAVVVTLGIVILGIEVDGDSTRAEIKVVASEVVVDEVVNGVAVVEVVEGVAVVVDVLIVVEGLDSVVVSGEPIFGVSDWTRWFCLIRIGTFSSISSVLFIISMFVARSKVSSLLTGTTMNCSFPESD